MATLTRPQLVSRPAPSPLLTSTIPSPFPREQLELVSQDIGAQSSVQPSPSNTTAHNEEVSTAHGVLHELMPSIVHVQKSCLMTLNNLLSVPTRWNPIVPDRRHSMPSSPHISTTSQADAESSSSALQTLVANLRNRDGNDEMVEIHASNSDSDLFYELRTRVESISPSLEAADALLANSLVSLLTHINRLSDIQASSYQSIHESTESKPWEARESESPTDLFDILKRQLSDLQLERLSSQPEILAPGAPPVLAVEASLLWNRIDEELEVVVAMCKERTDSLQKLSDSLPPRYDYADYQYDMPPEYEPGARFSIDDKSHSPVNSMRQFDEKMRLDLEGVTMAIDRLYLVAPQLHNQRVELKSSKLEEMEKARREGTQISPSLSRKQKERDIMELENIFDLLGKASERSLKNQSVILEGSLPGRMEKARLRDMAKREAFVEQLATHSDAGRFHGQDAILHPRIKDPHTLLSLPEFIQESLPPTVRLEDPRALLTLPEFVREPPPIETEEVEPELPDIPNLKPKKRLRHRSLSAPSLSWLRSSSKSGSSGNNSGSSSNSSLHSRSRSRVLNVPSVPNLGFDVSYVAENHENLQHVLVFFTVTGATPGVDIEAEVLPPFPENYSEGGDRLIIRSGTQNSLPLMLPARILPGKQEVRVQSGHYEIKLTTITPTSSSSKEDPVPLLDASHLLSANPTSFICASCSLPIVQSTKISEYRDLPSEHWEELVDAWMCHTDQKLHEQVVRHGQGGFWPAPGQAFVGGSYMLFEESSMTAINLHLAEETKRGEDWRLVRCICGAVIGRCQEHEYGDGSKPLVYRLLKYAIRPVSLTREPSKIPLSAFIVEDMTEFVQAHATYRFIILDEEEEIPRILVWLFKPSLRLAYTTQTSYAIPKSASVHAAKVLYKVMGSSERSAELSTILDKYPGFPQAEYLFYPTDICHRLIRLLKDSNTAYPESMRTMTGLHVGWLRRN